MCRQVIVLGLLTLAVGAAPAGVVTYTNQAAWQAAAGGSVVETFEGIPAASAPITGTTFVTPSFNIVVPTNHGGIFIGSPGITGARAFRGDAHGIGNGNPEYIDLTFARPITAFGADWRQDDGSGATLYLNTGDTASFAFANFNPFFFGLVSDTPFTSLRITGGPTGSPAFFFMDNVRTGARAVPEPFSIAVFGGLVAVGGLAARRRMRMA
jgi:hypothetical protein